MSTRPPAAAASRSGARTAEVLAALEPLLGLCEVQAADTARPSPLDTCAVGEESRLPNGTIHELAARSSAVLVTRHR